MLPSIIAAGRAFGILYARQGIRGRWRPALLVAFVALLAFWPGFASLPPTDRDEGRYVMATLQMVASGDYIDIRNQDEPRHKQPAGIYWLQAAAVQASGQGTAAPIGVYRSPSLLGAIAAVVLTLWAFAPLVGRRAAFLGATLLAAVLLLGVEARIAKTDAALLACVVLGLGVLVRALLHPGRMRQGWTGLWFWVAVGLGTMIKGPIILLVLGLAAAALCLPARGVRWLAALRPGWGLLLALAIALPWYVAIGIRTEGAFFANALGWNALGKIGGVHQGHGGPPGFYSALVWVTFWPAATLLAALLPWIWRQRRRREVVVLLCLILPLWLAYELIATKLPHYVLPAYPPLAVLVALALLHAGALVRGWWGRIMVQGFWLVPAVFLLGGTGAFIWFEGWPPLLSVLALLVALGLGVLATLVAHRSAVATLPVAVAAALLTWAGAWPMLARMDSLWLSPRMAAAVAGTAHCPDPMLASAGYHEPSFVFLTRTDALLTGGAGAADFLAEGGCRLAFVDAAPGRRGRPAEEAAFRARLDALGLAAAPLAVVEGRNMNGGHWRRMVLWRLEPAG